MILSLKNASDRTSRDRCVDIRCPATVLQPREGKFGLNENVAHKSIEWESSWRICTFQWDDRRMFGLLLFVVFLLVLTFSYFLPTVVAVSNKHPSIAGILLLNLFFGWSVLGWVISLVWAVSKPQVPQVIIYNNIAVVPVPVPSQMPVRRLLPPPLPVFDLPRVAKVPVRAVKIIKAQHLRLSSYTATNEEAESMRSTGQDSGEPNHPPTEDNDEEASVNLEDTEPGTVPLPDRPADHLDSLRKEGDPGNF
jgi:Superinfection immunity protein